MKINIFGASGAGVTTMGERLAGLLTVPYFDSDDFFWEKSDPPFTSRRNPRERNQMIRNELSGNNNWILGGSIFDWGDNVFPNFDLVVFLYLPCDIRIERLTRRELELYGDVIHANPIRKEQFEKFINWAADYENNTGVAMKITLVLQIGPFPRMRNGWIH